MLCNGYCWSAVWPDMAVRTQPWGPYKRHAAYLCHYKRRLIPAISHQEWLYLSGAKGSNATQRRDGDPVERGQRAHEDKGTGGKKKKGKRLNENKCSGTKRSRRDSDRVMGKILLEVMNVTLSFPLCNPGAFANYPNSHRSGPALLPTGGKAQLSSSAKCWPCYRTHRGRQLQPEIITF